MKILKNSSLCTPPNYSENKESYIKYKNQSFLKPVIPNENAVKSFCLRECVRVAQ